MAVGFKRKTILGADSGIILPDFDAASRRLSQKRVLKQAGPRL